MRVNGEHPTHEEPFGTKVTLWSPDGPQRAVVLKSGLSIGQSQSVCLYVQDSGTGGGMSFYDVRHLTRGWHPDAS